MNKYVITFMALAAVAVMAYAIHSYSGPVVSTQQQHMPAHRVQYTAKVVCGEVPDNLGDWPVAPGFYKTVVNVRNNTEAEVNVDKHLSLAFREMQPLGREPGMVPDEWQDQILLPPHSSTMDDCERIYQLTGLPPGTFLEGYLEFNAFTTGARDIPGLVIDAFYSAAGIAALPEHAPSITVMRIPNDYVM